VTGVDEARGALARGDWQLALELLDTDVSDDALQLRAAACYGAGDLEGSVAAWETLYAYRRASNNPSGAAWAACTVALQLLIDSGLMSPVRAWVRRAEELLEPLEEDPALAVVAMVCTYERFLSGDEEASRTYAKLAITLGRRLDVQAAVVIGRTALGRLLVIDGQIDEGLRALDDVAGELMRGEVDPLTTGMMYCEIICAAQGLGRPDLARDWTDMMDRWRDGAAIGAIHGRCRVHKAELLRLSGPADAAEREATGAVDELKSWLRRELGWPLVELGNIRRLRGDWEGAEAAYLEAHQLVWSPQPGLSLLRLEQGHLAVATALIADAIDHPESNPSKEQPPFGDLRMAPLLAAQVEIAAANGDAATTRRAADALAEIAAHYSGPALNAEAAVARARAALLEECVDEAIEHSSIAVETWGMLGAPFATGVARMLRGRAYHLDGNTTRAELDWRSARRDFEIFGAPRWAAAAKKLLDGTELTPASAPVDFPILGGPGAERVEYARVGDCRRIAWRSVEVLLPDLKGFRYLDVLLHRAGAEVHVMDLITSEREIAPAGGSAEPGLAVGYRSGLPVLDEQARDAYRRRLAEVDEDIEDAAAANDIGRLGLAEHDREHLVAELARAFGIDGQSRTVGGDVERARGSITRSLRYSVKRLGAFQPELAAHLDRSVSTGVYCCYRPDPLSPLTWDLD